MKIIFSKAVIRTLVVKAGWSAVRAIDGAEWSVALRARRTPPTYRVACPSIGIHRCRRDRDTPGPAGRLM